MRLRIACSLAALALLIPLHGEAAPILIAPGGSLTFNVDFTGASPAPPYTSVGVEAASALGNHLTISFYPELNGGGGVNTIFGYGGLNGGPLAANIGGPFAADGVFSFVLFTNSGATLDGLFAVAGNTSGTVRQAAVPVGAAVPEPASMLLLGTGLAGAGLRRWRQKRAA